MEQLSLVRLAREIPGKRSGRGALEDLFPRMSNFILTGLSFG
jgi:hypothetical protein